MGRLSCLTWLMCKQTTDWRRGSVLRSRAVNLKSRPNYIKRCVLTGEHAEPDTQRSKCCFLRTITEPNKSGLWRHCGSETEACDGNWFHSSKERKKRGWWKQKEIWEKKISQLWCCGPEAQLFSLQRVVMNNHYQDQNLLLSLCSAQWQFQQLFSKHNCKNLYKKYTT